MALNFPADTTNPYVDPASGLKYIFNQSVGAWETAIQPPAVIGQLPPDIRIPGFLWWDNDDGSLYIYYDDGDSKQWVEAVPAPDIRRCGIGVNPPDNPIEGDLWWDVVSGRLYIYYDDGTSAQWIEASPNVTGGGVTTSGTGVYSGDTPPTGARPNDLWYDTVGGNLYIYYQDANSVQWVIASTVASVSGRVDGVTGTAPIVIGGSDKFPDVSIEYATSATEGSTRFATQLEVNTGTATNVALTPGTLRNGIDTYLPNATETVRGVAEVATNAEAAAGVDDTKIITPAKLSAALTGFGSAIPAGTVIAFAGQVAPAGYLSCDGQAVARGGAYADLFSVIGTDYGAGDGATTFNVPDLRGEFVRGWDNGKGIDAGRALGSFQGDEIRAHSHSGVSGTAGSDPTRAGGGERTNNTGVYNTNSFGGAETRPRNIALHYCIKY